MLLMIEGWDYLVDREPDGRFLIWHHVSPADAGYGTEIRYHLPADYLKNHSVKEFYERLAAAQMCRPLSSDKRSEIAALEKKLRAAGWI